MARRGLGARGRSDPSLPVLRLLPPHRHDRALFLLNAGAGAVVAVAVAAWDRVTALVAGLLFSAGTLAAFFASVAVGLFGFHERLRGPWQEAAGVVEALAVVVFVVLIAARSQDARPAVNCAGSPASSG
jgi:hypothetical protein